MLAHPIHERPRVQLLRCVPVRRLHRCLLNDLSLESVEGK